MSNPIGSVQNRLSDMIEQMNQSQEESRRRLEELRQQPAEVPNPSGNILESFLMGQVQAPPTQNFEQFFRKSVSPAREFLDSVFSGTASDLLGRKFETLREQKFEEFQQLQTQQSRTEARRVQAAGLVTQMLQDREQLEFQKKQFSAKQEIDQISRTQEFISGLAEMRLEMIELQNTLENDQISRKEANKRIENLDSQINERMNATESNPVKLAQRLLKQDKGRDLGMQDANELSRLIKLLSPQKDQPQAVTLLPRSLQALSDQWLNGFMSTEELESSQMPGALAGVINSAVTETGEFRIPPVQARKFHANFGNAMAGVGMIQDLAGLAVQARAGQINPEDPGVKNRVVGLLNQVRGTLGHNAFERVFRGISGLAVRKLVTATGDPRVSDKDAQAVIEALPTSGLSDEERNLLVGSLVRQFMTPIVEELKVFASEGRLGPAPRSDPNLVFTVEDVILGDPDSKVDSLIEAIQAEGGGPVSELDVMKAILKAGGDIQ